MPPAVTTPRLVIFTDLDGTLLDASTYSAAPARAAMEALEAHRAAVVFCSAKTAAEQRALREQLGLTTSPFIVENGSALFVPDAAKLPVAQWRASETAPNERQFVLGVGARAVREAIRAAARATGCDVTGYADLSSAEVATLTGLSPTAAVRAGQRDFSETLVGDFSSPAWPEFLRALSAAGMCARAGGRFYTVTGGAADKGHAVQILRELYARESGQPILAVGLGDSANDESLLGAVDRAYLLPKPDGTFAELAINGLKRVGRPGPRGWEEAIVDLLSSL